MIKKCAPVIGLLACALAFAANAGFDQFKPMTGDVGTATLPEATPFKLSSPNFSQTAIVARDVNQARRFDSGSYDMITANETGPEVGRYLFNGFETKQAGIQRTDLNTMTTVTIWSSQTASPALHSYVAFDASRWTPWGSLLAAEESWSSRPGYSNYGRLFEVTNPLANPTDIQLVHRNILPRVAHEGLAFDNQRNLYFIDEHSEGHIYRFTSAKPNAIQGDVFFAAGQSFVLRVGKGMTKEATGSATWIPLTDINGAPLPGAVVVTDASGLIAIDGRATAKHPAFLGTVFDRPEDIEIKTLKTGTQILFVATTTQHKVFSINLFSNTVKLFASQNTKDMATGQPVGNTFKNPDNLAIDAKGNIYIVEDQPGGVDDIWFAQDEDNDGVAETIGKWASLSTAGAESTGLYFDKFKPNVAYVNVQHPNSGVDRTIRMTVSCPKGKDDHSFDEGHPKPHDKACHEAQ